jgi:hypothetical protein
MLNNLQWWLRLPPLCGGGGDTGGGGGIMANRVKVYKRKFEFRPQETLPSPDFVTADGQKILEVQKSSRGAAKISNHGVEKSGEQRKKCLKILVIPKAREGAALRLAGGGKHIDTCCLCNRHQK